MKSTDAFHPELLVRDLPVARLQPLSVGIARFSQLISCLNAHTLTWGRYRRGTRAVLQEMALSYTRIYVQLGLRDREPWFVTS